MSSTIARRADIPALTGLRFLAAILVVVSHAIHALPGAANIEGLTKLLSNTSALGMTLFFVLSGFVIHYNYRESVINNGASGIWDFFVARFARLYPLYIILLTFDLWYNQTFLHLQLGTEGVLDKFIQSAPYYLTLTQSWFYGFIGQNIIIYQLGRVGSISWSISTEWFFYCAYPLVAVSIFYLTSKWSKLAAILILSFAAIFAIYYIVQSSASIDNYALRRYGFAASTTPNSQDSLFRWIIYFSPYSRISEFILGALVCGLYVQLSSVNSSKFERSIGAAATFLSVVIICGIHAAMFDAKQRFPVLTQFHMAFGYALPVAALIFCVARYDTIVARICSWRPFIRAGEASYSLYLLHIIVLGWFSQQGYLTSQSTSRSYIWTTTLLMSGIALVLALASYKFLEVPTRRWFRFALAGRSSSSSSNWVTHGAVPASRAAVMLFLILLPFGIVLLRSPPILIPAPDGTITIVEATYGGNCGAPVGNASKPVAKVCQSARGCEFTVDVFALGDPAGGCAKDFSVQWRCLTDEPGRLSRIPEEAGLGGKSVKLACNMR